MSLIAPFKTGLDTDAEPWLAPADSFSDLDNLHIKHGYLQKRDGYRPFGALVSLTATTAINAITQANPGQITTAAAHGLTTGDQVYLSAIGGMVELNNKIFTVIVASATEFTIGIDTSALTLYTVGGTVALTSIVTDRVMGITRYIEADATKTTLAFNARRADRFDTGNNIFVQLDVADIFSSGEHDYVWATNWQSGGGTNRLYFTNGKSGTPTALPGPTVDGIRYYDSAVSTVATTPFNPTLRTGVLLVGGKLIFTLGQRLVVLSPYESTTPAAGVNYPQRARWCAKQNPANWNDVTAGGGGYTDAATGDQIISARAIQNQIIVFFTNSVWSLLATSDPNRAFKWQKINNFRACDGKMASIGYDRYVVALGVRGITATDGVETRRIDDRISDFTINDINVGEFQKVFCERSFSEKKWWTLYNTIETTDNESDSALIYDDDSSAFSTYTIALNCLGYGNFAQDFGLDDFVAAKDLDLGLDDFGDENLFSYFWQENQETLLGGDINGNVFVLETDGDDNGGDISATFTTNAWNPFIKEGKECLLSYVDFYLDTNVSTLGTVYFYKDTEVSPYTSQNIDFLPNLNFVSSIINATATNPVNINSSQHGLATGDIIYIYGVVGMTDINSGEESDAYTITVVDGNNFTLDGINGLAFPAYSTGGGIYLKKFYKTKTWKRIYCGGVGFQHRIRFTSSGKDKQFRIHGFSPSFKPVGTRSIN